MFKHKIRFEDQEIIKNTLRTVAVLCFFGTGLLGANTLASGYITTSIGLFAGTVFSACMYFIILRGNLTLPRIMIPPVTFVIVVFLVMVGAGVLDEAVLGFALIIALGGLLVGRIWVGIYTGAGILAVTIIGLCQVYGWFPRLAQYDVQMSGIIVIDILLLFIGAVIYIIIANLERVLDQVKERETELAESNQALLNIQAGLEERIAERVRHLNNSREDAEAAHLEIERQVWQTTGLAQLGDLIRGEQEAAELAAEIIRHLCTYLDAQVGALFLREQSHLQCVGVYACSDDHLDSFEIGEGIVGQAAQDQQTVLLTDIPEETIRISSGLIDLPPKNLIAVPFSFDDEVTGVFEIGSLLPFDQRTREFLEKATESISVAFHTVETRAQVDQLLVQTRKQTEELQEQQEELRAINEELEAQAENLRVANQALQAQTDRLRSYERQGED